MAGLLEPCRCLDAGLAFAFAHHHQAHHIELDVPPPPLLEHEEAAAVEAAVAMNMLPVWDAEPEPRVPADGPRRRQEEDDGIHQPGHQDDPDVEMENFFY